MKSLFAIAIFVLNSSFAFAGPKDLIGKWVSPCYQTNPSGSEFGQAVTEFKTDGTVESLGHIYSDSKCQKFVTIDGYQGATYTATDWQIRMLYTKKSQKWDVTVEYIVTGDTLAVKPIAILIDGKAQDLSHAETSLMKRK